MGEIYSDTGPFAVVPEWVLDVRRENGKRVSDRAVRLYSVLGRHADSDGRCIPSRRTLAERMECSTDSVDRASRELQEVGALEVRHRTDESGDLTSNLWRLKRAAPVRPGGREPAATPPAPAATGGRATAAENETQPERETRAGATRPAAFETDFDRTWAHYPRKVARKAALRAYTARRRAGVDPRELHRTVQIFARTMAAEGRTPDRIMHGATFFGSDERWKDFLDWSAVAAAQSDDRPAPGPARPVEATRCPRCDRLSIDCTCSPDGES